MTDAKDTGRQDTPKTPEAQDPLGRGLRLALWILICLPAAAALCWSIALRTCSPELAVWRSARFEAVLNFDWTTITKLDHLPAYWLGETSYLGLLAIPGGDFHTIHLASWCLALLSCLLFHQLLRAAAGAHKSSALTLGGLLVFTFWTFSPAFGSNWLVGARSYSYLGPLLLLCCLLLLRGGRWWFRFWLAALLAQCALFVDRNGLFVWIALTPVVWIEARRRQRPAVWFPVGGWLLLGNLGTLLCYRALRGPGTWQPGLAATMWHDPAAGIAQLARLLGTAVPELTPIPRPDYVAAGLMTGLFLALVLVMIWRRRAREEAVRAAPWLALGLYGLGMALVLCESRISIAPGNGLDAPSWVREQLWPVSFLLAGVAGLAAVYAGSIMRLVKPVGIGVLLVLVAEDWASGWQHLQAVHRVRRTVEAELAFVGVAQDELPVAPVAAEFVTQTVDPVTTRRLRSRGLLAAVPQVPSLELGDFDVQKGDPSNPRGGILKLTPTHVEGLVRPTQDAPPAGLVMLTRRLGAGSERIFTLVRPYLYDQAELYPWVRDFTVAEPFQEGEVVRAYGFEVRGLRAHPFANAFRFQGGAFHKIEEAR